MEKVSIPVADTNLVGDLHGLTSDAPSPAVAIIGPMTYQKEQAPAQYARRLAAQGFVALNYDSRYRGESGGEPRDWENPFHKVEDLKAAIAYLRSRPDVDPEQVSVLAVCQGSAVALRAVSETPEVRALVTIAGHYRDPEGDAEWLGNEGYAARIARGQAARARYDADGVVEYVKAVDQTEMDVAMPGEFVWVWYEPWARRGAWSNRYAVMSDADLLAFDSIAAARTLPAPWLMIHGDFCFLPSAAQRHMDAAPETTMRAMVWDDTPHLAYYDDPAAIDLAVGDAVSWFKQHGARTVEPVDAAAG